MLNGYANSIVERLDEKINTAIKNSIKLANTPTKFTVGDLNGKINNSETLLDYIRDSEKEFNLKEADVFNMDSAHLTSYIAFLDDLWRPVC